MKASHKEAEGAPQFRPPAAITPTTYDNAAGDRVFTVILKPLFIMKN